MKQHTEADKKFYLEFLDAFKDIIKDEMDRNYLYFEDLKNEFNEFVDIVISVKKSEKK